MTTANILSMIGIVIGLLIHITATAWWASAVNTTLKIVVKDVGALVVELKAMRHLYVTKEEHIRDFSVIEKERAAMWKKIDSLVNK